MKNMLSDKSINKCEEYDIVFIDVPYVENQSKDLELEKRMFRYRFECENIVSRITNKKYIEKQIYYSMGILCLSSYLKKYTTLQLF